MGGMEEMAGTPVAERRSEEAGLNSKLSKSIKPTAWIGYQRRHKQSLLTLSTSPDPDRLNSLGHSQASCALYYLRFLLR